MPVEVAPDVETGHIPLILMLDRAGALQLPADLCLLLCSHSTPSRTTDLRPHVLRYLLLSMLVSAGFQALSLVSPGRCSWRLRTSSDLCAGESYPLPTYVPHRKLQRDRQTDKLPRSGRLREHTLYCSSWYSRYQSAWTPVCTSFIHLHSPFLLAFVPLQVSPASSFPSLSP